MRRVSAAPAAARSAGSPHARRGLLAPLASAARRALAAAAPAALAAAALLAAPVLAAPVLAAPLLAAPVLAAPAAAGDELVRPGKWNPKKPPKGWVVFESKHYQVQSQCGKAKAQALAAHLESMLEIYADFLPTRRKLDMFVLKLFKNRAAFVEYGKNENAVAYYSKYDGELVGYDTGIILGKRDIPAQLFLDVGIADRFTLTERQGLDPHFEAITDAYVMDTARVLSHEGWHQYFHFYTVSIVDMPSWLDEGVGDYFFMATRDDQPTGSDYRLGDLNQGRLRVLQRAMEDGTTVTFERLMDFVQQDYYSNASVYYAQGWSMVHYLMQNPDPKYRELIPELIRDFKDTKNFRKSTDKVFKGLDLKQLDRDWIGWVLSQTSVDPMRHLVREYGTKLKSKELVGEKRWLAVYDWYLKHPEVLAATKESDGPPPVPVATTPPQAGPPPGNTTGSAPDVPNDG
jgi:hypothetical protein